MSTSDNHSHKEEKRGPSAIKQSVMENEEEKREPGNSSIDELTTKISELNIKRTSDRKETEVKFLINVPMEVTPEMSTSSESHCQKFLDLLNHKAFRKEDELRYKDIAVIFGLNGMEPDVRKEMKKNVESDIRFEKMGFAWPNDNGEVQYRLIREEIKKDNETKKLVNQFREDSKVQIYFCFFDADTDDFNEVLSSYIDVIMEHNYPTVMSTGFLFPKHSKFRKESEYDREVRIITAEHFPLGTYYPEPNFCVLLPDGRDTLPECFDNAEDTQMNMESPVLMRQVKQRKGFSAVFANKNPIITPDSRKKHSHRNPRTWAISAFTHKELIITSRCRDEYIRDRTNACGIYYFARSLLVKLLKSEKEAHEIEMGGYFAGDGVEKVFRAAKAVREYLSKIQTES